MGLCSKCADKSCHWYGSGAIECLDFKPETNADKIRAATDEELVEFFRDMIQDCGCNNVPCQKFCENQTCEQAWLDWLKQEVET